MVDEPAWVTNLTRELATMPELCHRLLERHTADGSGRCRGCTSAGTGSPAAVWPCALRILAQQARRCHHDQHPPRPGPAAVLVWPAAAVGDDLETASSRQITRR